LDINENIKELKEKFKNIRNMGYVKSTRNLWTGVGKTFEDLIGKQEDKESKPDFFNIEIKTKLGYTKTSITLFSATPNSDDIFVADRLRKMYGYPDKDIKDKKVLNCDLIAWQLNPIGMEYYFKLNIASNENKMYLQVYDRYNHLIEDNKVYWDLNILKEKLYQKMEYLALIKAWSKK